MALVVLIANSITGAHDIAASTVSNGIQEAGHGQGDKDGWHGIPMGTGYSAIP